jgi:hypothetical protein
VREGAGSGGRKIYQSAEFKEVKGFIDELLAIREKMHYIFGNKSLKNYRHMFSKPTKYSLNRDSCA